MKFETKTKIINIFKWTPISWIWNFPTIVIGIGVLIYSKIRAKRLKTKVIKMKTDGIVWFQVDRDNPCYGVSLFPFIFLAEGRDNQITIRHETGHMVQAMIMSSWLYLILVGLPSGISNTKFAKFFHLDYDSKYIYYQRIWERSADFLGNIKHTNLRYDREIKPETRFFIKNKQIF